MLIVSCESHRKSLILNTGSLTLVSSHCEKLASTSLCSGQIKLDLNIQQSLNRIKGTR